MFPSCYKYKEVKVACLHDVRVTVGTMKVSIGNHTLSLKRNKQWCQKFTTLVAINEVVIVLI